ncbi:MAG: hypothetical protein ABR537_04715 [Gemmatimonadales bacterium]
MLKVMLSFLILLAATQPAAAYPNMIRLGYAVCATCHVSPQGGGVLTPYGKGIDYAQTLRAGEPPDAERSSDALTRFLYDVRLQMAVDHQQGSTAEYSFNTNFRSAVAVNAQNRLVYAFGVRSPALSLNRRMGAASLGMSRLYWMYQPRQGMALVVGRDELPTGLGLPGASSFYRSVNNPNVSSTPTQAKMFWWNNRWQLAGYGYGPDGNEAQPQFEARGAGAMAGLNVWKDRAVIGLTTRVSKADAFDRRNAGVFARVGFNEHLGVLAEHDVTERELATGSRLTHLAGHAEVFFVPANWLQTSLAVEHLNTVSGASTYRLSPSAELRLTPNFRLQFSTRNVYAATDSRTYSIQLQVKAE